MPDYDPKSIPVLDDVIDEKQHENIEESTAEIEHIEPALIDFHDDEDNEPAIEIHPGSKQSIDDQCIDPGQQISLQPIVEDIVKQLIPDLEQKLRILLQQALEDKLPAEIIKPKTDDN
jgi:hypothetical protein